MEKVINLLSKIEEKASQIIDNANNVKLQFNQDLENKKREIDEKINNEMISKIDELKNSFDSEIALGKKRINDEAEAQIIEIEKNFESNYDIMVDKIFKNIIEV